MRAEIKALSELFTKGALTALKRKEAYVIYENTPTEQRGICLPIIYNNSILGVIAIGGGR